MSHRDNELHRYNLAALIDIVQTIPQEHFDITLIMDPKYESDYGRHCGTLGCCLGYMALDPWFNEQGLRYWSPNTWEPNYSGRQSTMPVMGPLENGDTDAIVEVLFGWDYDIYDNSAIGTPLQHAVQRAIVYGESSTVADDDVLNWFTPEQTVANLEALFDEAYGGEFLDSYIDRVRHWKDECVRARYNVADYGEYLKRVASTGRLPQPRDQAA